MDAAPTGSNSTTMEGKEQKMKKKRHSKKKKRNDEKVTDQSTTGSVCTPQDLVSSQRHFRSDEECVMFLLSNQRAVHRYEYWEELFTQLKEIPLVLEHHKIKFLPRKSEKPSREKIFKCSICGCYFGDLEGVNHHMKDYTHLSRIQNMRKAATCILAPELPFHMNILLTNHLEDIISTFGLSSNDILYREKIQENLNIILNKMLPGSFLDIFGSSYHKMGLKNSDLNLSLIVTNKMEPTWALSELARIFKNEKSVINLKTFFNEERPHLTFNLDGFESVLCTVSLNIERINALSRLLLQYSLFDERVKKMCVLLRLWGQVCKLDLFEEGSLPSFTLYMLVVCYLLRCRKVLPVIPDLFLKDFKSPDFKANPALINWKTDDEASLSELWISMIAYYSSDDSDHKIIYITQTRPPSRKIYTSKKRMLVFDPFTSKIFKSVCTGTNQEYINYCFKNSYYYYNIPHTKEGPIFGFVRVDMYPDDSSIDGLKEFFVNQNIINSCLVKLIPYYDRNYLTLPSEEKENLLDYINTNNPDKKFVNTSEVDIDALYFSPGYQKIPLPNQYANIIVRPRDAEYLMKRLDPAKVHFSFQESTFTLGKNPPKCCTLCFKEDHVKSECPEDVMPPLEVVPDVDDALTKALNELCSELYERYLPSAEDIQLRNTIVSDIELYLKSEYPNVRLTLFGSSRNGFGLKGSDLDICMTFDGDNRNLEEGLPNCIEKINMKLLTCPNLKNLVCISTAKVPIIKFVHESTQLGGDISLYNSLAQENTALLNTYSQIDKRVKILGTMMKKFAKVCNIGDASKGSLSSYSYTIMVIFYLQKCSPPVLPVLQELPSSKDPFPVRMIDDCNCYYFSDLERLSEVWPQYKTNKSDVGFLWIDMLRFYTEIFDLENLVISIRTTKPLRKFKKLWISKNIAIEDPFNTQHNLASALSRKMNIYIIQAFRKGRCHFSTKPPSTFYGKLEEYYYDPNVLANIEPPNDRGCFICKSIGHKSKNCPSKSDKKIKNKEESLKQQTAELNVHQEPPEITPEIFKDVDFDFDHLKEQRLLTRTILPITNMKIICPKNALPYFNTVHEQSKGKRKPNNPSSFTQMFKREFGSDQKKNKMPKVLLCKKSMIKEKNTDVPEVYNTYKELINLQKNTKFA